MAFCSRCGNELNPGAAFCSTCGAPQAQQPNYQPQPTTLVPTVNPQTEEQEFLDTTHRLLRWEKKAWHIAGKVFLIMGIVFAALFCLLSIVFALAGDYEMEALAVVYFLYSIIYGAMFIALGIVSQKAEAKIPQYLDTLYTNFRLTYDRCGSVGMLIFNVILGAISPIFFIINFVRMKTNKDLIMRIMARQQQ